ncbi:putative nucleotidyltransferase substrate binding domain-containing protein [Rhodococcus tukisamuensis]|uniref:CBS domain-containing protein n=1 Tax=Rhodococcus tukisamuensis TaxID=168276 RepID=A0A1G6QLK0_9NOCA|nr:putative nucleotidyltransferase substrate binding domain-containing protein [Rhodococcus tukisamuensis]SDC93292.1 CBS domain-containing protein [Rhodococcus tukisamuensis]
MTEAGAPRVAPLVVRDPAMRPAGELLRGPALTCAPETPAREAAELMTRAGRRCVLIPLAEGAHGIFTDGDLRRKVVAAGLTTATPVSAAMTAPVRTVPADRLGADVLMDMLELGVRHMPVRSASGALLGVLEDVDLLAAATRSGFLLRGEVARAADPDALVAAAARVPDLVLGLWRARVAPLDVSAILSVIVDAAAARALQLVTADRDGGAAPFAWLSLGSVARREAMPGSDVDSALAWADEDPDACAEDLMAIAARVHDLLDRCGFPSDDKGAVAARPRFARSGGEWLRATGGWIADPYQDKGIVMISLLTDSRVVWGADRLGLAAVVAERARANPQALRLLLREAVEDKARIHSLRQILTRRTETVDLKSQGVMPIVNVARWAGLATGSDAGSTTARLQAASGGGLLPDDDARVLAESFDVLQQIRLRHQCEQLEQGLPVTDELAIATLTPLYRSLLANAVREVAGVQRKLAYAGPAT